MFPACIQPIAEDLVHRQVFYQVTGNSFCIYLCKAKGANREETFVVLARLAAVGGCQVLPLKDTLCCGNIGASTVHP